ncbi:hypothetical protein L9F63_018836, partial [Diploptera punctata]
VIKVLPIYDFSLYRYIRIKNCYDLVLTSTSDSDLQKAFDQLMDWAKENELTLNEKETLRGSVFTHHVNDRLIP